MTGQHRQHHRVLLISREARPIHRHHHFHARADQIRNPVAEEFPHIDPLIAQQPVDLLDSVLAQLAQGLGQSLTDRMYCQRGAHQHSQGCVGQ